MDRVLGRHIVTGKGFPDWVKQELASGKGKLNADDGEFQSLLFYTPSGTVVAKAGDVVLKTKAGIVVVPQKARKYMEREAAADGKG